MNYEDLPSLEEIQALREFWLKEKQELKARQEANPDIPVILNLPDICLGILNTTEKMVNQIKAAKPDIATLSQMG